MHDMITRPIKISVVISAYNNSNLLKLLLTNLYQTKFLDFEVIIVDDASTEDLSNLASLFPIIYLRNKTNLGVAKTRMIAARKARGEILLSLDSDVIPYGDLLTEVNKFFTSHPQALALSGFAGTAKENTSFFARFKLWRDWSYWNLEADKDSFYWFKTSIGAIKRKTFFELGGYPNYFFKPGVNTFEDLDFSYRLAKKGKIFFDPDLAVGHRYGGLIKLISTYFKRTILFVEILVKKRHFPGVATTSSEAITIILSGLCLLAIVNLPLMAVLIILFILRQRKFLYLCWQKEGLIFAIGAFFTDWLLCLIIIGGGIYACLRLAIKKLA